MTVRVVDSKRRIVLGGARPGQAFSVTEESDGRIVLTRLEPVRPTPRMSFEECRDAIEAAPLQPTVFWDELREVLGMLPTPDRRYLERGVKPFVVEYHGHTLGRTASWAFVRLSIQALRLAV